LLVTEDDFAKAAGVAKVMVEGCDARSEREGARQRESLPDCVSFLVWHRKTMFSEAVRNTAAISE